MSLTTKGWKNKNGIGARTCKCGSWKQHWVNASGKSWPAKCSVVGCNNPAVFGAHIIINSDVSREYIVPVWDSCNNRISPFDQKQELY